MGRLSIPSIGFSSEAKCNVNAEERRTFNSLYWVLGAFMILAVEDAIVKSFNSLYWVHMVAIENKGFDSIPLSIPSIGFIPNTINHNKPFLFAFNSLYWVHIYCKLLVVEYSSITFNSLYWVLIQSFDCKSMKCILSIPSIGFLKNF